MKKLITFFVLIISSFMCYGCNKVDTKDNKFKLEVVDNWNLLMHPLENEYEAGSNIEVHLAFRSGPSVGIIINDEELVSKGYSTDCEYLCQIVSFTMPNEDTIIYTHQNGDIVKSCGEGNHIWDEGQIIDSPVGGSNKVYTCTICGKTKTESSNESHIYLSEIYNWIDELDRNEIVKVRKEVSISGLAPGSFNNVTYTTEASDIMNSYNMLFSQLTRIDKEEAFVSGESIVTYEFILKDKSYSLAFINSCVVVLNNFDFSYPSEYPKYYQLNDMYEFVSPSLECYSYNSFDYTAYNYSTNEILGSYDNLDEFEFVEVFYEDAWVNPVEFKLETTFGTLLVNNIKTFSINIDGSIHIYELVGDKDFSFLYNYKKISQLSQEDFENMSDKEFLSLLDSYKQTTILESLYIIDGKQYGRTISSSDSKEDAIRVCTRHFTDNRYPQAINTVVDCSVIYESDILYGLNVKWEVYGDIYEENVISFKKSVADITVRNVIYGDQEAYKINTNIEEQLREILLYLYSEKYFIYCTAGFTIIDYEFINDENNFVMNVYNYEIMYGDWDVLDSYSLVKYTIVLTKASGNVEFLEPEIIKTVYK